MLWIQMHWIWIRIQDVGQSWIRDPDIWLCYQFWIFFYKKLWRKITYFKVKQICLKKKTKIMTPEEICCQFGLWMVNIRPQLYIFCLLFILFSPNWIQFGSGSITLINKLFFLLEKLFFYVKDLVTYSIIIIHLQFSVFTMQQIFHTESKFYS